MRGKNSQKTTSGFDLVPPSEEMALICMAAADDDPEQWRRIYYDWRYADVWRVATLQKARRYEATPQ